MIDQHLALPRTRELRLSPDGSYLVAVVSELSPDRKKYNLSLWRIPTTGDAAPSRVTDHPYNEGNPRFLSDGTLVFTTSGGGAGPDGQASGGTGRLWILPGGDGRQEATPTAVTGVTDIATASHGDAIAFTIPLNGPDLRADGVSRKRRADAAVMASLHEHHPANYWSRGAGSCAHLFVASVAELLDGDRVEPLDITPDDAGQALNGQGFAVAPDGAQVVTGWFVHEGPQERRPELVALDVATRSRSVLMSDTRDEFYGPAMSPDGKSVACIRKRRTTYDDPPEKRLWLARTDGTDGHDPMAGIDLWPMDPVWAPDGHTIYFVADQFGGRPIFRLDIQSGSVSRLTTNSAAYSNLCPAPDGRFLYALKNSISQPPVPVRLSPTDTDQEPADLLSGGATFTAPGTLTRVNATASDGQTLHGWLALPEGASAGRPAPLVLWIHGGPLRSWNHWHPHSHPWILAAHGYAVLMADPALSTGYGQDYLRRGWGNWGGRPYADLMTLFDAIAEREDIDGAHAAAMGASFGGYMASWIAVNTTRFKAIVTHAGIWTLEHFACTSDIAPYWVRELGDPLLQRSRYEANSPHLRVAGVSTPILISHGGMDHRVPVGESLRLWHDLCRHGLDGKFLFFPDEGHCILQPGNVKVWYETILAFLDHHLLGKDWDPPLIIGESQCRERSYDGSH